MESSCGDGHGGSNSGSSNDMAGLSEPLVDFALPIPGTLPHHTTLTIIPTIEHTKVS